MPKRTPIATGTSANALNPRWPWKHTRRYRTVQESRIRPIGLAGRGNERCRGVTRSAGHCDGRGLRGGPRKRTHAFKRGRIGRTFCLYPGLPPSTHWNTKKEKLSPSVSSAPLACLRALPRVERDLLIATSRPRRPVAAGLPNSHCQWRSPHAPSRSAASSGLTQ